MQSIIDTEFSYHGISFDERMAIFSLFRDDEDLADVVEQISTGLTTEGCLQ